MLRFILISFFFICLSIASYSQYLDVHFDNNADDSLIKIDTALGNIWQIGKPQKLFLNNSKSQPNAIVTDTLNFYPVKNTSSFVLGFPWENSWDILFSFKQKYNCDTLADGGFIEIDRKSTRLNSSH